MEPEGSESGCAAMIDTETSDASAPAGTSILTAAMTFGIARYRVGADVVFVVLAAMGVGALLDRYVPAGTQAEGPP